MSARSQPAVLQPGVTRLFGRYDLGEFSRGGGWSAPEDAHAWNDGPEVTAEFLTGPARRALQLAVEGEPFLGGGATRQEMTLFVNGWRLGFWRLSEPRTYVLQTVLEPEQLFVRRDYAVLRCVWHLPGSVRPADRGIGSDTRELGFCFRSVTVGEPV